MKEHYLVVGSRPRDIAYSGTDMTRAHETAIEASRRGERMHVFSRNSTTDGRVVLYRQAYSRGKIESGDSEQISIPGSIFRELTQDMVSA